MAGNKWIRLEVGWADEAWIVGLSAGARLAWLEVLCRARCYGFGGRAPALSPKVAARRWSVREADVTAMLEAAVAAGVLSINEDGDWAVAEWAGYLPPRPSAPNKWKRLRLEILERDGWVCQYCGGPADQVDHIKSRKQGGTDDPDNLASACGFCNRSKKHLSLEEWRGPRSHHA